MTIKLNYKNLFHYLIDTAVCQKKDLEDIKIDVKYSKNLHWTLNLPDGDKLVVKQEPYHHVHNSENIICNERHISDCLQSCPDLVYAPSSVPEIIYFDDSNSILIYKYPNDYINLVD